MRLLIPFLLAFSLFSQTRIDIDAGSASDTVCTGATDTKPQFPGDNTVRYHVTGFSCVIPWVNTPALVTLEWRELSQTAPNMRLFSVKINDQQYFDQFDVFAAAGGQGVMIARTVVVHPTASVIKIDFKTQKRSAMISAISVTPFPLVASAPPTFTLNRTVGHGVGREPDGSYLIVAPRPGEAVVNLTIYRNGLRQTLGSDYSVGQFQLNADPARVVIAPKLYNIGGVMTGWLPEDSVTSDFDQVSFPLRAVIPWCWADIQPGASWAVNSVMTCEDAQGFPADPKKARVLNAVPVWFGDGYHVPRPVIQPNSAAPLLYEDVAVFKNGSRLSHENLSGYAEDYTIPSRVGELRILPIDGSRWPVSDYIIVDYTAVFPPQNVPE